MGCVRSRFAGHDDAAAGRHLNASPPGAPPAALEFMVPGDLRTATGGYEYDRRMIEGLRARGWSVRVHALDGSFPAPTAQALNDAQSQLAALSSGSLVLIDGLALGAMPDEVHAHAERLRLIALVHHPLAAEVGLSPEMVVQLKQSERRALQAMRLVIVTSHATCRALADYGVAAHRIAVVEPGVDEPRVDQPRAAARDDCEPSQDDTRPLRLLCVATLTPRKGHDLLVDALAGLREHAWVLTCVGDLRRSPETVSALRARIACAGLEDRITLTGELDASELTRQLQAADVFVLATRFEGYGMAVAQALAHGLPVVSTRTGAIAELVPAHAGLIVEPNDAAALKQALARLLGEPGLRRRLASGARAVGAGLSDWRTASERLAQVLIEAAQRPLD